jgi:hypothetical protein
MKKKHHQHDRTVSGTGRFYRRSCAATAGIIIVLIVWLVATAPPLILQSRADTATIPAHFLSACRRPAAAVRRHRARTGRYAGIPASHHPESMDRSGGRPKPSSPTTTTSRAAPSSLLCYVAAAVFFSPPPSRPSVPRDSSHKSVWLPRSCFTCHRRRL